MLFIEPDNRPEVKDILLEHFPKKNKQLNAQPSIYMPIRHANDVFQSKLLMLFLTRGIREDLQFQLGSDISQLEGKFGDVIFKFQVNCSSDTKEINQHWRYLYVEAKNKKETLKITTNQLLNNKLGDFCLAKYFRSYHEIRRRGDEIVNCIICTNIGFDVNNIKKNGFRLEIVNSLPSNILIFDRISLIVGGKRPTCYKLVIEDQLRQKFIEHWSDSYLLAKRLHQHATTSKPMMLHLGVFKLYQSSLIKENVLDSNTKNFHNDFVNSVNLSSGAKILRRILCKLKGYDDLKDWKFKMKIKKTTTSTENFSCDSLPQMLTVEDVDEFFNKLVFAVDKPNVIELNDILNEEMGHHFDTTLLEQTIWTAFSEKKISFF
jgi:hypothetical protein